MWCRSEPKSQKHKDAINDDPIPPGEVTFNVSRRLGGPPYKSARSAQ